MFKKAVLFSLLILFVSSCHKNDSPVGIGILPQGDIITGTYKDFFPSVSYTHFRKSDSILLTSRLSNSILLGSLNDPVFGRTDASIYCSFETPYSPGSLNGNIQIFSGSHLDSAVLTIGYDYQPGTAAIFVGDTSDPLSLNIYPLKYNLNTDSNYYSSGNNYYFTGTGFPFQGPIPYDESNSLIQGGKSILFNPSLLWYKPIKKDTNAYNPPQLKIRLRDDFSEGLFANLNNNATFQQYMKGMFITTKHSILPQPSYGSLFFVYMDGNTYITFYWHNPGISIQNSLPFYCNGSTCNRFSYFKHDYTIGSPDLLNQLNHPDSIKGSNNYEHVYLQGAAGAGVVLNFDSLLNWVDSNITINKAELILKTDRSNSDFYNLNMFPLPGRVYLEGDTLGGPRGLVENIYTFGGYYDVLNNQYLIEIPHTVGQIINRKTLSTKFYLTVYNGALFPERLVLGGTGNKNGYAIKLRVWYTKLTTKK